MRDEVHVRCSLKLKNNLDKLYPDIKSMRLKTEKLNLIIEEMLYGKTKQKRQLR